MQEDPMTHTSKPDIAAIRARAEAARAAESTRVHGLSQMSPTTEWHNRQSERDGWFMDKASEVLPDIPALCSRVEELERLLREACDLAISFDVHGSQPGERDRVIAIRQEAFND
jgi:hypothetical protein